MTDMPVSGATLDAGRVIDALESALELIAALMPGVQTAAVGQIVSLRSELYAIRVR